MELDEVLDVQPHELVDRDDAALDRMMAIAGNTKPSMLQDLEQGRATEVDVVNGGVAERGRAHSIPTPFNDRVVELVHAMEEGERAPSPDELDRARRSAACAPSRGRQRGAAEREHVLGRADHGIGDRQPLAQQPAGVVGGERAAQRHDGAGGRARRAGHAVTGKGADADAPGELGRLDARRDAGELVDHELTRGGGDEREADPRTAQPPLQRERAEAAERPHPGRGAEQRRLAEMDACGHAQRRRGSCCRRSAAEQSTHRTLSGIARSRLGGIASPHASQVP